MNRNILTALAICFVGALLEGLCAGSGVKKHLAQLKWPSFSPPLWAWYAIAVVYYAIVFVCSYRILEYPTTTPFRSAALTLLVTVVILNAIWNILFFRAKNLRATFVFSLGYSIVGVLCWFCLLQFDNLAASVVGIYTAYLLYANVWGYRIWRLNSSAP